MKKAFFSSVFIAICILALSQVPESFNYQVVVRDGNNPLTNQNVSFQMSILKGSTSGESQYSELHSTNTGALGIVNLVIGNGTDKTGNISTIDWGADTYYLKVEIDKTGGSSYVEMGTTQLLSVPYALYSKVSETADDAVKLTGNQTIAGDKIFTNKIIVTQQGIGTATPDASSALEISSTTQGFLPPRMTNEQMTALAPVEGLVIYNTTFNLPLYYNGIKWVRTDGSEIYAIGKYFKGGIIAYVLKTGDPGYVSGETHGLIVAPFDQSTNASWGCEGILISGADGTAIGSGNQNTNDIVNGCPTLDIAARICSDLSLNGYSDWFLPSYDELKKIWENNSAISSIAKGSYYWCSSEYSAVTAYRIILDVNSDSTPPTAGIGIFYKNTLHAVRAVRAF